MATARSTKDIDLAWSGRLEDLERWRPLDHVALRRSMEKVFSVRGTHKLPEILLPPPADWERRFAAMATECGLPIAIDEAFRTIQKRYAEIGLAPTK